MSREDTRQPQSYFTIIQGDFRTQVAEDHPEAVRRDWKSADGSQSGTKFERVVRALYGYITDISFADGEYGMQWFIKLDKNADGKEPTIARINPDVTRKSSGRDVSARCTLLWHERRHASVRQTRSRRCQTFKGSACLAELWTG